MSDKRFKLSKYVTPSSVSNFCDENGRMLNKEVVKVLNELVTKCHRLEKENDNCKNDYRELFSNYVALEEKNEQLHKMYHNLGQAIVKTCNDLNKTEEVYLADFNICRRITEYEKELWVDE